jgi:uncharacterized protein
VTAIAPALYEGTVRHRRFAVRERAFTHRISLAYAAADPARAAAVRAAVARDTGAEAPDGPVGVLTQRRVLGVGFNPVSFFYLHDADGALRSVVAEVTSTPWGETTRYVIAADEGARVQHGTVAKRMHVSPFLPMDQHYSWTTTHPSPSDPMMSIHIAVAEGERTVFDATLKLRRAPVTRAGLARHALLRLRVLPLIYAHALVLALARVPIHPHHPKTPKPQEAPSS